ELQDAIPARAARQQAAEYSDDFESDDDGMLNSTVEELPESNSDIESTKKSIAFQRSLSEEDTSQKAVLLENEAADDLPFHEGKAQQKNVLENKNMQDDEKDSEEEYLESENESGDGKNDEDCSLAEVTQDHSESGHCNDLCMPELQKEGEVLTVNREENKPIPKQRMRKVRHVSASGEKKELKYSCCYLLRHITIFKKYIPVEDNDLNRTEVEIISRNELSSISAISEKKNSDNSNLSQIICLFVTFWSKGDWLEGASPPLSIHFTNHNKSSGDSNLLICGDAPSLKEDIGISKEDNATKSPSVIDKTKTSGYEKTRKLEKSRDDSSEGHMQIVEGQLATDIIQEVSVDDKSEHTEVKNTTKDFDKENCLVPTTANGKIILLYLSSCLYRSLCFSHLKKNVTALPSAGVVSSQYLGTLQVLEGKQSQKCSAEVGKADSIRAAVYQDWLEKKRVQLLELKRNNKKQAENLKNNIEKKEAAKREEAIASFEAWKAMKERAAKKLSEKRKLEELNKKKVAEQDEEKREAARKAFEKWKERKVEYLRELNRKEKQSERIKKKKEEEFIAEKKRDSMSAVEKWNEKKEEYIKQKKVEKILERRKQEMQQAKKEEKDKRAMEEYERWLEKKERKEQLEKKQRKLKAVLADKAPSPWSPPGKVTY
ncbi:MAP9 protein, partial [Eudromia elegans]|nr:MAP9 protein [Eudromia elegans]